jgi:hypothetical protein
LKNKKSSTDKETTLDLIENKERVTPRSYALTKHDLGNIETIKDKCLNKKIVLNDSHVIRLSLEIAAKLTEEVLIKFSQKIQKVIKGRPKGS